MRLLIVSHVIHYCHSGGYHAYSPYAKEIEIWADLFAEVVIAAPWCDDVPPKDACRISRSNVRLAPQKTVGGTSLRKKAGIVLALPSLITGLGREMSRADAIHVRCPGNLGLLGILLAPLFSRRLIAKFAGQWDGYPGEVWTVRLQRSILRSRWWRGPVTVYGKKPREAAHVVDFFSAMFTAQQLLLARACVSDRPSECLRTVAFAGRLTRAKNVDVLLRAIATLKADGVFLKGLVIGDGPEKESLQALTDQLGIASQVKFTGAVAPESLPDLLRRSGIFVLVSRTEGWPKSIAEAMAFGLICVGSDLGMIPAFLADGRGFTVPPGDVTALADTLRRIASKPEEYEVMRERAAVWAQRFSTDALRDALGKLMIERWQISDLHSFSRSKVREAR